MCKLIWMVDICKKRTGSHWLIGLLLAAAMLPMQAQAQVSVDDFNNRGFEDGNNTGAFWNVWGGTANFGNTTNLRTGTKSLSHAVATTTAQRIVHLNNTVTVPAGNYVHFIYWARTSSSNILRSQPGITISNLTDVTGTAVTPTTTYARYTFSRQNTRVTSETAYGFFNSYLSTGTTTYTGYYDDFVTYTGTNSVTDIVAPGSPTCLTRGASSASSISISWNNGADPTSNGGTGVQGSIILRRTGSAAAPTLNQQGTYSPNGGVDGASTSATNNYTIIGVVPASQTTFTDNTVAANTTYYYSVINYDLARNYSVAATPISITSAAYAPDISQSIQNVTKGNAGGTFTPGDRIRINVSFSVPNGMTIHNVRTRIFLPSQLSLVANSMAILDNKGVAYGNASVTNGSCTNSAYTEDGSGTSLTNLGTDDRAQVVAGLPGYAEIMLGERPTTQTYLQLFSNTNGYSGGRIRGGASRPLFYTSQSIIVASVLADIIAPIGGEIDITSESFYSFSELSATANLVSYKIDASNNPDRFIKLVVSDPALPSSYLGRGANLFTLYNYGTFGNGTSTDGSTIPGNPNSSPNFVLQNITTANQPNDGNFSVSKNSSTGQLAGWDNAFAVNDGGRVFGHWYVLGDHTGQTGQDGNIAPAAATESGYMMLVNADYVPKRVVTQMVNNLCPGTLYNFKAWFRNICPSCGVNSETGNNLRSGTTLSTDPRGQGVKPNLTFDVNQKAYYTTGPIDTSDRWIQKQFIFATGPNSGNYEFSIRNNANGGDGNDWAIDDIEIITRGPVATVNVDATPVQNPNPEYYCIGQQFKIIGNWLESTGNFTQYDSYQFQYAYAENGPWMSLNSVKEIGMPNDPSNPTNGRIDSVITGLFTTPNTDVYFRIAVATQPSNISLDDAAPCQVNAFSSSVIKIGTCILPTKLLRFRAASFASQVLLNWATPDIDRLQYFELERSTNGVDFYPIKRVNPTQFEKAYEFNYTDLPVADADRLWYRLKLVNTNQEISYSAIEWVGWKRQAINLQVHPNPAKENVMLNWSGVKQNQRIKLSISNALGTVVHSETLTVTTASQHYRLPAQLKAGVYYLVTEEGNSGYKQTIKINKL